MEIIIGDNSLTPNMDQIDDLLADYDANTAANNDAINDDDDYNDS